MKGKLENYPNRELTKLNGKEFVGQTVDSLVQLADLGAITTDAELTDRINMYFDFCVAHNLRPGVQTLCLALNCSRQSFWCWCHGDRTLNKSSEWVRQCRRAKGIIDSFLETSVLEGKISPPSGIFLLKNYCNYSDVQKPEIDITENNSGLSVNDIPAFDDGE